MMNKGSSTSTGNQHLTASMFDAFTPKKNNNSTSHLTKLVTPPPKKLKTNHQNNGTISGCSADNRIDSSDSSSCTSDIHIDCTYWKNASHGTMPRMKQFLWGLVFNLFGKKYPSKYPPCGHDLSWIHRNEAVEASNLHLVLKLHLWKVAYEETSKKAVKKYNLEECSTTDQDIFANELLPKAICAIAASKVPVWIMSNERIVELIPGIDELSIAELITNTSSYSEFSMVTHISNNLDTVYVQTSHYSHCFDPNKDIATGSKTLDIFYGINLQKNSGRE